MNTGTVIVLLGLGAAAFLYWKSQRDQAAALAAAQAAPGPGLVQRAENTVKVITGPVGRKAITQAAGAAGGVTRSIASGAGSVVGAVKGIF